MWVFSFNRQYPRTICYSFFSENVPKSEKKKKNIRKTAQEIENAVIEVISHNQSVRSIAKSTGIAKSMLARLVKKARESEGEFSYRPNIGNRKIFTEHEEQLLEEYIKKASKMAYGLTRSQVRGLAFQYANKLKKSFPNSWTQHQMAGVDWYNGFVRRHSRLSLRKPEKTSLARSTAFNKHTVEMFYNNLKRVLEKYKFSADNIYNADETGLLTVTDQPKILAQKGAKQVAQVCSQERGQLVTMLTFISATGNTIPPAFIFPRVHYKDFMLEEGPVGSLGLAFPSGWMDTNNFISALKHFIKHAKPTKENPVLLIMDNHETHVSIDVIIMAKENNVVILTLPPHCSHKLQPLDVAVLGPFKTFFKCALNDWMINNPGKTATIYTLPKLAKSAYEKAYTIKNITAGFRKAGIFPFDSNAYTDDDFVSASVTDRPFCETNAPSTSGVQYPEIAQGSQTEIIPCEENRQPVALSCQQINIVTPETVRPFAKAEPRKNNRRGRKKGSSKVMTDTPEIIALKAISEEKENKRKRSLSKQEKTAKRKILQESSSDDSGSIKYDDSESGDDFSNEDIELNVDFAIKIKDFVLVKFETKEKNYFRHAVGRVLDVMEEDEFRIKFMKKSTKTDTFKYPVDDDISEVNKIDIVMVLPEPQRMEGSKRVNEFFKFPVDLSNVAGII